MAKASTATAAAIPIPAAAPADNPFDLLLFEAGDVAAELVELLELEVVVIEDEVVDEEDVICAILMPLTCGAHTV